MPQPSISIGWGRGEGSWKENNAQDPSPCQKPRDFLRFLVTHTRVNAYRAPHATGIPYACGAVCKVSAPAREAGRREAE